MLKLIKRGGLALLVLQAATLPLAALAVPVTIVTHSTGIASLNPTVLRALGQQELPTVYEVPYTLTLRATFDWLAPLPVRGEGVSSNDADLVIDFHVGDLDYHYAGIGSSSVDLYTPFGGVGDAYGQEVSFDPNHGAYGYSFTFSQHFIGPAGSMGPGGALNPALLAGGASPDGYADMVAYYNNDEFTFRFPMSGDIASYAVQVTSPVPEPASFALLAAGLLTLGLRRKQAR